MAAMPHFSIDLVAEQSADFRQVLWTGVHAQLVIMTIPPGGEIGAGEQRHDPLRRPADEHREDDLAFRDEEPFTADQVALLHVAIGRCARVVGIVDRDEPRHAQPQPPACQARTASSG